MNLPPLVLYHAGCWDGFTAAWVLDQALRAEDPPAPPVLRPVHYGDPVPDLAGRRVFVVDVAWAPAELIPAAREALSVTLLDHHRTAEEQWAGVDLRGADCRNLVVQIDRDRAGARLAWDLVRPGRTRARRAPPPASR